MKTPHVHAEVIKAWADGAQIQENMYAGTTNPNKCWVDIGKNNQTILWSAGAEYRVKPEPKPDIIKYYMAACVIDTEKVYMAPMFYAKHANIKVVFDGETRELKSVELLNDRS